MTTRPGYVWDNTNSEWVEMGQAAVLAPVKYQATAPTSPATGDIWIDSDDEVPGITSSLNYRWRKIATGGETSLSGNDVSGLPLAYNPGYEQLYINGILQYRGSDYIATTGNTITGLIALVAGDTLEVLSFVTAPIGDAYTQTVSDAKFALRTGPTFSAYASAATNIAQGATVKIGFQTEEFDTNNNYDTTLSRFTPTVAGYYQITALVTLAVASSGIFTPFIYKNGTEFKLGATQTGSGINFPRGYVSSLVYANGTTDYFEIFAGHSYTATVPAYALASQTYFTAAYVRGV
jgi:hypothetical protein